MASSHSPVDEEIRALEEQIRLREERLDVLRKQQKERGAENEKLQSLESMNNTSASEGPLTKPNKPKFPTYEKRKGTVDQGKEFEILMCALYALKFGTSDQVVDFQMTTNNNRCGDFDDIEIEATFKNDETHKFLFQLKHKEKKEIITEETLTKEYFQRNKKQEKNKLYLLNYLKSIKDNSPNVTYILYTNSRCDIKDGTELSFRPDVSLTVRERVGSKYGNVLINVSTTNEECSVFQFTPQFYLFASQDDVKRVKEDIEEILKAWLTVDIYSAFEHFMKTWWSGNFVLTKHDVIAKLTELSLSPYIRTVTGSNLNEKSELLAQAIMDFDITIIKNCDDDTVAKIWRVSEEKHDIEQVEKKFGIHATEPTGKSKVLWYLEMVPLVVAVDNTNVAIVTKTMTLLRSASQRKRVILKGRANKTEFVDCKIFESLADLSNHELYDKITSKFMVSLQGRECIALRQLIDTDAEITEIIKITELLKMAQNEHIQLGANEGTLSDLHITRKLAVTFVDTADILHCCSKNQHVIIVNCDQRFQKTLESKGVKFSKISEYLHDQKKQNFLLLSPTEKCTRNQFDEVEKKSGNSNVYLFQVFDQESMLLLRKTKNSPFPWTSNNEKSLGEETLLEYFNNTLNVVCAPPGMGKSVLLRTMSSEYCPPNMWSVYVNLIALNPFLHKKSSNDTILNHILKADRLQRLFYKTKQIMFFFDGLDEVDSASISPLLDFIKHISAQGIRIWLSSRENLKEKISQTFDVMMAEEDPLHLAIIYRNMEEFQKHIADADENDSGGRNALQLACSFGTKYGHKINTFSNYW